MTFEKYANRKVGYDGLCKLQDIISQLDWSGMLSDDHILLEVDEKSVQLFKDIGVLSDDEAHTLINSTASMILFSS